MQTRREGTIKNGAFVQDGPGGPGNYLLVHASGQQLAELKQGYAVSGPNQPLYYTDQIVSLGGLGNYDVGAGNQIAALPGETLVMLAQRIYGDAQLWYVIAEANGLGDPNQELAEGLLLTVPGVKVSRNSAETFKPYSPGEAIGSTAPGLPYIPPAPGAKCGAMSKVISVIVTAVVSYFAGGAAGAAAGNYAGQMSQLMFNGQYDWSRAIRLGLNPFGGNSSDLARSVYDPGSHGAPGRIDYKSIAVSAASAAATAGISQYASYLGLGTVSSIALQTVATTAANYQINKWAGYDVSWSNRQLGQNLVTAGISAGIAAKWGTTTGAFADGKPLTAAGIAVSNGLVSSAVGKLVSNTPFNWSDIATSAATDFAMSGLAAAIYRNGSGTTESKLPRTAAANEDWSLPSPFATGSGLNLVAEPDPWQALGGFGRGTGLSFASQTLSSATNRALQSSISAEPEAQTYFGLPKGLQDHINTPAEDLEVSRIVRAAAAAGVRLPNSRSYPIVKAYEEWGFQNPHDLDAIQVYADPKKSADNVLVDRLLNSGRGWGVLNLGAIAGNAVRNQAWPTYRAPRPVTWMGTGSAAAWRDMKTAQANYSLGPIAAPIGYLGGAAKAAFESAEFLFDFSKTLGGSVAFVTTGGALGASDFMRSAEAVTNGGKLLWNSLGESAYYHSFGLIGQQEHQAFVGYMSIAEQGFSDSTDSVFGAWSRGEYLQAGGAVGGVVGLPLPVSEAAVAIKAVDALDDLMLMGAATRVRTAAKVANSAPSQLYRLGRPASPLEKTFDHALSPQLYVEDVAAHYGISLRGSGQPISVLFDETLGAGKLGVTYAAEGGKIIRIGPDALVDQATTANTIAHELSHARDYLRGVHKPHGLDSSIGDRTVYGSGNALEAWIKGYR
ncbi:Rhs family protein [Lysobacter enzymogenes]|uniref:Rhs family protein n=1 Tax=Lysobacter enzymogenes TaxID=69 RepID=A0A0S2DKT8_LYSEN|nr:Rhs family protein [Lysobacter enzymogenes]